jgi:hypothetical protein
LLLRPHDAATLVPARPVPTRHWRSYGDAPLPTGIAVVAEFKKSAQREGPVKIYEYAQ